MAPFCYRCDRTFVSYEGLHQHLENSSVHNPRPPLSPPQRRHQRRGGSTLPAPHARRANNPRDRQLANAQAGLSRSELDIDVEMGEIGHQWYPHFRQGPLGRWLVGFQQVPMTGSLLYDELWSCVLCERQFVSADALRQHMANASNHLSLLNSRSEQESTSFLERLWQERILAPRSAHQNLQDHQPRDYLGFLSAPPSPPQPYMHDQSIDRWESWEQREDFISYVPFRDFMDQVELESGRSSPEFIVFHTEDSDSSQPQLDASVLLLRSDRSDVAPVGSVNRAPTPDSLPSLDEIDDINENLPLEEQLGQLREKMAGLKTQVRELKSALKQEKAVRQCSMCYERENDTVTECGHQFCNRCLIRWQCQQRCAMSNQALCPMCRAPMGKLIKMYTTRE
ncbi:hypothetical protein BGZ63DRAFT_393051 [Mariannaea sp. PMI_226]|nr:hypothetical protein BGZ63DRAFT_393051 [Mariannaea sp. PMI_226]